MNRSQERPRNFDAVGEAFFENPVVEKTGETRVVGSHPASTSSKSEAISIDLAPDPAMVLKIKKHCRSNRIKGGYFRTSRLSPVDGSLSIVTVNHTTLSG